MPKIVSNTTPIISLLKLNKLNLLQKLYTTVYIPSEVFKEIETGKTKAFYLDLSKLEWIQILEVQDKQAVRYFIDLDAGEAETIILATEIGADLTLLDEKVGRIYANHAELKVTGTIGVLIKAKQSGLIPELKPLLEELTAKDVWISEKLKREVLRLVGEE